MTSPLEPSAEQMRRMGHSAVDFAVNFIGGLEAAPADGRSVDPHLRRAMLAAPGEEGSDFGELLGLFGAAAGRAVETAGHGTRLTFLVAGCIPRRLRSSLPGA
jgi:hypothetical protein